MGLFCYLLVYNNDLIVATVVDTAPPTPLSLYIGVLWLGSADPVPGAPEAVNRLRTLVCDCCCSCISL